MREKFEDEIRREQEKMLELAGEFLHEAVELVENYLPPDYKYSPLTCLGSAIKAMDDADYVLFAGDWQEARGCKIEMACAVGYDKKILLEDNGKIEEAE